MVDLEAGLRKRGNRLSGILSLGGSARLGKKRRNFVVQDRGNWKKLHRAANQTAPSGYGVSD